MYGGKRNVEKNLAMLTYAVIFHHRNDSSSLPTFAVREKSTIVFLFFLFKNIACCEGTIKIWAVLSN